MGSSDPLCGKTSFNMVPLGMGMLLPPGPRPPAWPPLRWPGLDSRPPLPPPSLPCPQHWLSSGCSGSAAPFTGFGPAVQATPYLPLAPCLRFRELRGQPETHSPTPCPEFSELLKHLSRLPREPEEPLFPWSLCDFAARRKRVTFSFRL